MSLHIIILSRRKLHVAERYMRDHGLPKLVREVKLTWCIFFNTQTLICSKSENNGELELLFHRIK